MKMRGGAGARLCAIAVLLGHIFGTVGHADTSSTIAAKDRFWILWERVSFVGSHCPGGAQCQERRSFSSRPLDTSNTGFIYRLFGVRDGGPRAGTLPRDHPDAPVICQKNQAALSLGFDPRALPRSEKGEVLRGVKQLHLDLTTLKPPPGFDATFGSRLHKAYVGRLREAGIRVVPKDQLHLVPGQPTLNLYFSFSDPDDLCKYEYSVFASLSQEVLLTRDLRIKVAAGVWSYSTGSTAKDHQGTEADAILRVLEAFVRDHQQANAR
ncbi:hypothetical protein [Shimia sp. MIT910701]|uniref:hypothetical protein n=1 Tax=Shimia sp. MIT910701 TaxID=3096987 RepID=UPI00399B409C